MIDRVAVLVVYLASFFVPFRNLRLEVVFFTLSDALFLLAGALLLIAGRRTMHLHGAEKKESFGYLSGLLMVCVGLLVSSMVNGDPVRGGVVVSQYLYALLFIPLVLILLRRDELINAAGVFLLGFSVVIAYGVYLYYTVPAYILRQDYDVVSGSRMGSLLGNPNAFAKGISATLFVLFSLAAAGRVKLLSVGLYSILSAFGLMVASSFGGILSGLMAYVMGSVIFGRRGVVWIGVGAIGVVSIFSLGLVSVPEIFVERVFPVLEGRNIEEAGSFSRKVSLWNEAVDFMDDALIVGLGADEYVNQTLLENKVHNTYLLLFAEGGAIAFFGFLLMLGALVAPAVRDCLVKGSMRRYALLFIGAWALFLLSCLTNVHVYGRAVLFPLIMSYMLYRVYTAKENRVP